MREITTIGLDLAKNVFQVHAIDARLCNLLSGKSSRLASRIFGVHGEIAFCLSCPFIVDFDEDGRDEA